MMKRTTGILAGAVVAAAIAVSGQSASADVIHYTDVSAGGVTISNITETNSNTITVNASGLSSELTGTGVHNFGDPGAVAYYGQPTFDGSNLVFGLGTAGTNNFAASGSSGTSDTLLAKLTFEVTSSTPMSASAFLTEFGNFSGFGGGFGSVTPSVFILNTNGSLEAPSAPFVDPSQPFIAGTSLTTTTWSDSNGAAANTSSTSFIVEIDNDLVAGGPNPVSNGTIEKKGVTITIGQGGSRPPAPEPASLSLLGVGAVALIARRRKA
jgi:hypothetical protein